MTIQAYVTTRSLGMCLICSWVRMNIALVPGVLVSLSPCVRLLNSFPNAAIHKGPVAGSSLSFMYCVMLAPVTGCVTGAQNCSGML